MAPTMDPVLNQLWEQAQELEEEVKYLHSIVEDMQNECQSLNDSNNCLHYNLHRAKCEFWNVKCRLGYMSDTMRRYKCRIAHLGGSTADISSSDEDDNDDIPTIPVPHSLLIFLSPNFLPQGNDFYPGPQFLSLSPPAPLLPSLHPSAPSSSKNLNPNLAKAQAQGQNCPKTASKNLSSTPPRSHPLLLLLKEPLQLHQNLLEDKLLSLKLLDLLMPNYERPIRAKFPYKGCGVFGALLDMMVDPCISSISGEPVVFSHLRSCN